MVEQTEALKLKILELTADVRKFEIGLFWSRSLFFWGFTSVAIASYGAAYSKGPKELQFAAACLGIVCSIVWTLTNRSSKYWQKVWEVKAANASCDAVGRDIFKQPRSGALSLKEEIKAFPWWSKHFSVSKLAIAFSEFTALVWLGLAFKATAYGEWLPPRYTVLFAGICTGIYLIYIVVMCGPDKTEPSN
jgi:hypothetical protein